MFKILNSLNGISIAGKANRYGPVNLVSLLHSTFQPRDFQLETVVPENGTPTHRFSRYIAHSKRDWKDPTQYNFKYSFFYPVYRPDQFLEHLKSISNHDISKLICLTTDIRSKSDVRLYTDVLNALDEECEDRVDQCSFYELVRLLHGFMYLLPTRIFRLKTYRKAMPRLVELFNENRNDKDFMSVVFFLGLCKRDAYGARLLDRFLKDHMEEFFDQLALMDFVVLADACFKTGLRVESDRFASRLQQEIGDFEGNDVTVLVALLKSSQLYQVQTDKIVEKLRKVLRNDASCFSFQELTDLLKYLSESRIKDDELNRLLLNTSVKRLNHSSQSFRPEDLANFLRSCSKLSIPFEDLEMNPKQLTDIVFNKVDNGEYQTIPDTLVDTCLSLWMMGHQSIDMLSSIYGDRQIMQFFKQNRERTEPRRDLLLACAEIERPESFKIISKLPTVKAANLTRSAPENLVQTRPGLRKVKSLLEGMRDELGIREMKYNLPIKFVNIAGLLLQLEDDRFLNVEVLESEYCLSDDRTPAGMMNLKLRLMNNFEVENTMVNMLQMESDEQLTQLLRDIVQKIPTEESTENRKTA
ncbi:uncharacterized protein LOC128742914 [Sabethes cyaneus]|uniref:uncharacterized protein LOC128742914 n=1 Tax=Sabethes cyaneus TaxID=53552 RepID=UPI00237ED4A3|nr:uncharacterized protein LOC128742914 [Sabethes cyaneus]